MSKIETINTWNDGLVSDLNPLNTPNTVLTDCLNGTFLTYNGNEISLQNDMGNYKLEYCRLSPNYIPVGVKEYGDILYIVSQNPLDNNVEIGSYPSPAMYTDTHDKDMNIELISLIDRQKEKNRTSGVETNVFKYSDLTETSNEIVFSGKDYKMYPGDKYCLMLTENGQIPYKYEYLDYNILDEGSKLHNVSNKIKVDYNNPKDYEHVAWTVPGWMSVQSKLAELATSGININSFYYDSKSQQIIFSLNLKINLENEYLRNTYLKNWEQEITDGTFKDLGYKIALSKEVIDASGKIYYDLFFKGTVWSNEVHAQDEHIENEIISGEVKPVAETVDTESQNSLGVVCQAHKSQYSNIHDLLSVFWKKISGVVHGVNEEDTLRITITPLLRDSSSEEECIIEYNNLEKSLLFDLSEESEVEWGIGNKKYQFFVTSDNSKVILNYDIEGPLINTIGELKLSYSIADLLSDSEVEYGTIEEFAIGENVLTLDLKESLNTLTLKKEGVYCIEFILKFGTVEKRFSKLLIPSEVFNEFPYILRHDSDLTSTDIINKYMEQTVYSLSSDIPATLIKKGTFENIYSNSDSGKLTIDDNKFFSGTELSSCFSNDNSLSDRIITEEGTYYEGQFKINSKPIYPYTGDLWNWFNINSSTTQTKAGVDEEIYVHDDRTTSLQIPLGVRKTYRYQSLGAASNIPDVRFIRFNEKKYKIGDKIATLNEIRYQVHITVGGRKSDDSRTISVEGQLYVNQIKIGSAFTASVSGISSEGIILMNDQISNIIDKYNLPFLFVEIYYSLVGGSSNWKLIQSLGVDEGEELSTPLVPYGVEGWLKDFEPTYKFEKEGEVPALYRSFIAFDGYASDPDYRKLLLSVSNSNRTWLFWTSLWVGLAWRPQALLGLALTGDQARNIIQQTEGNVPVLIPFSADTHILGLEKYENFCKNFCYVEKPVTEVGLLTSYKLEPANSSSEKIPLRLQLNYHMTYTGDVWYFEGRGGKYWASVSNTQVLDGGTPLNKKIPGTELILPNGGYTNDYHRVTDNIQSFNKAAEKALSDWSSSPLSVASERMVNGKRYTYYGVYNRVYSTDLYSPVLNSLLTSYSYVNNRWQCPLRIESIHAGRNAAGTKEVGNQVKVTLAWTVRHNKKAAFDEANNFVFLGGCYSQSPDLRFDNPDYSNFFEDDN